MLKGEDFIRGTFDRIGSKYLAGHEIGMTFLDVSPLLGYIVDPFIVTIRGSLSAGGFAGMGSPGTDPRELRAWLLGQAHDMIFEFAEAGWLPDRSPGLEFAGSVERPMITVAGLMVKPPVEYGIELRVDLSLMYLETAPKPEVKVRGSAAVRGSMSEPFSYAAYEPPAWEPKP